MLTGWSRQSLPLRETAWLSPLCRQNRKNPMQDRLHPQVPKRLRRADRNRPSRRKSRGLRQLQHSRIHQLRRKPPDQQNRSRMSLQFLPKQRDQIQRSRQNPRSPNRPIRYIPRRTMTALYGKQPPMPKAMRRKASPLSGKTPWSSAGMLDIWEHRELNTKV